MARVSISFQLPEQQDEFEQVVAGRHAVTVLRDTLDHVRHRLKCGEVDDGRREELEEIRRVIIEEARDRRVPIDE